MRATGSNPDFPAEERAKVIHFTKSPNQFNLSVPDRIAFDHDYTRFVVGVSTPKQRADRGSYIGVELNSPKAELCVETYIRGPKGGEKFWGGMGIERLLPPRDVAANKAAPAP